MTSHNTDDCSLDGLAEILRRALHSAWRESDFPSLWNHQLNSPLSSELEAHRIIPPGHAVAAGQTFQSALLTDAASLELIGLVKQYAQALRDGDNAALPKEVALMLYYLALATAWTRHRRRLSSLPLEKLMEGWTWASSRIWIDSQTRTCLENAARSYHVE